MPEATHTVSLKFKDMWRANREYPEIALAVGTDGLKIIGCQVVKWTDDPSGVVAALLAGWPQQPVIVQPAELRSGSSDGHGGAAGSRGTHPQGGSVQRP